MFNRFLPIPANGEVARGAEMLDELSPNWYRHIDTDHISLHSNHACILGQLVAKDPVIQAMVHNAYERLYAQGLLYWPSFQRIQRMSPLRGRQYDFADVDHLMRTGAIGHGGRGWSARDHGFMPTSGLFPELAWKQEINKRLKQDEAKAKAAKALRVLEPDQERLEAILDSYVLVA